MTQCEVDARRAQINQSYDEKRYQVNVEFNRRRQAILDNLNASREQYNCQLMSNQSELERILNERSDLRRQGLDAFNEQMQANYNAERQLQNANRIFKAQFDVIRHRCQKELTEAQLWNESEHAKLRKEKDAEMASLFQQYEKEKINQSINQSINQ